MNKIGKSWLLVGLMGIVLIFSMMIFIVGADSPNYTIDGDKVYYSNEYGSLEVYSHTSQNLRHQEQLMNITWDYPATNLDFAFILTDTENSQWTNKRIEIWQNYSQEDIKPIYDDVEYSQDCSGEAGTNYGLINDTRGWCNDSRCTTNSTDCYYEKDFTRYVTNASGARFFWNETELIDFADEFRYGYKDVSSLFSHEELNNNHYYFIKGVSFEQGETKHVKINYDTPVNTNGKWSLFVKRSVDTTSEALSSGNYILLDPWWNSSWDYRQQVNISVASIAEDVADFELRVPLDSTNFDFTNVNEGCTDLRFTNETDDEIDYIIEYCDTTAQEAVFWVEKTIDVSEANYIWVYYGNAGASYSGTNIFSDADYFWLVNETSGTNIVDYGGEAEDGTASNFNWINYHVQSGGSSSWSTSNSGTVTSAKTYVIAMNVSDVFGIDGTEPLLKVGANSGGNDASFAWSNNHGLYVRRYFNDCSNKYYIGGYINSTNITTFGMTTSGSAGANEYEFYYGNEEKAPGDGGETACGASPSTNMAVAFGDSNGMGSGLDNADVHHVAIYSSQKSSSFMNASFYNYRPDDWLTFGAEETDSDTTIPSEVTIDVPTNATSITTKIQDINFTAIDETALDSCWWSNDTGATNNTLTDCNTNITSLSWDEGWNVVTIWVNDTSNNVNNSDVSFFVDSIDPTTQIVYPTNTSYTTNTLDLNFTAVDTNLDKCWYFNGTDNSTLNDCKSNFTGQIVPQGSSTWTIYANDSLNNVNSSEVTFYVDSIEPNTTIVTPTNRTYTFRDIDLNISVIDTNKDSIWYAINTNSNTTISGNITQRYEHEENATSSNVTGDFVGEAYNASKIWDGDFSTTYDSNRTLFNDGIEGYVYENYTTPSYFYKANLTYASYETLSALCGAGETEYWDYNTTSWKDSPTPTYLYSLGGGVDVCNYQIPINASNGSGSLIQIRYQLIDSDLNLQVLYETNISWEYGWYEEIEEGNNKLVVCGNDTVGNENCSEVTFYVDSVEPSVVLSEPNNDTYTLDASIDFKFNLSEQTSGAVNCTLDFQGVNSTKTTGLVNGLNTITIYNPTQGYGFEWNVKCTDLLGNIGTSKTYVVDTSYDGGSGTGGDDGDGGDDGGDTGGSTGGGGATGTIVIVETEDANWTISTVPSGNSYVFSPSPGSQRVRPIVLKNYGTKPTKINLTCSGDFCDTLVLGNTSLELPIGTTITNEIILTLTIPEDTPPGTYYTNIIATDEFGNEGIISLESQVGKLGFLLNLVEKLKGTTEIFGITIYNIFILLGLISSLSVIFYFIGLNNIKAGAVIAFLLSLLISTAVLFFL